MAEIRIRKADGTWVVRAAGAVIAETDQALELSENGYDEVIYFPRSAVAMAFLDKSDHTTVCPHKGVASYFHIVAKSFTLKNAAWSYESPNDQVIDIKDHLAFYPGENIAVERI